MALRNGTASTGQRYEDANGRPCQATAIDDPEGGARVAFDLILDECFRNILANRPVPQPEAPDRTRALAIKAVPDCLVTGLQRLVVRGLHAPCARFHRRCRIGAVLVS